MINPPSIIRVALKDFKYVGEQLDGNCGFYYNRARWMDPSVGRFASVDPFAGIATSTVSFHRYLYANASPISFRDPSGEISLGELNSVLAIRGELIGHYFNIGLGFNDAANGQSAEEIGNGVMIGAAFAVGVPVFGVVAKLLLPRATQILKAGGWLSHHEGGNLGHTLDKHVNVDRDFLLSRLTSTDPYIGSQSVSRFFNQALAEKSISDAIRKNRKEISKWLKDNSESTFEISHVANENIGEGIRDAQAVFQSTSRLKVVLKRTGKGYHIHTSFPDP